MTNIEKIINLLKDKELTIKEIISSLPEVNKNSIMGCINSEIKKGITFERISKGKYKLKE